jgi:hypothetical protein
VNILFGLCVCAEEGMDGGGSERIYIYVESERASSQGPASFALFIPMFVQALIKCQMGC